MESPVDIHPYGGPEVALAGGTDTQMRDRLAWQRTVLANERTLLAYVRTALGFLIAGIPALWWPDQAFIHILGGVALAAGIACLVIGIHRFLTIQRRMARQVDSPIDTADSKEIVE